MVVNPELFPIHGVAYYIAQVNANLTQEDYLQE